MPWLLINMMAKQLRKGLKCQAVEKMNMKNARFLCGERGRGRLALLPVGRGSSMELCLSWPAAAAREPPPACSAQERLQKCLTENRHFPHGFCFCNIPLENKIPLLVNLKYYWLISLPLQCPSNQEKLEMGHERGNLMVCWCQKEAKRVWDPKIWFI